MPPIAPPHAAVLLLAFAALAAHAQTPPAKPAAKPAAGASTPAPTRALGGGAGSGKLLTRDELRACMKRQESLAVRRTEAEAAREPIDREKTALVVEQDALKVEREKVESSRKAVSDLNGRYKAHAERIEAWNAKAKELQSQGGKASDKERAALDAERAELQQAQVALEADRKALSDSAQQVVAAFNTRAQALDQKVADWNRRNNEYTERVTALNRERDTWVAECADRRYREEDEIAIKKGE